jgi:glycosyltransferase involved in cell wall biosynthesis
MVLFNWRSVLSPNAGGAEIHLYEIFTRMADKNQICLVASCNNRQVNSQELSVSGLHVAHVTSHEFLYPLFSMRFLPKFLTGKFDVIVEDISKVPIFWPLLISKLLSIPFVIIIHHVHGKTLFEELPSILAHVMYTYEIAMLKLYTFFKPHVVTVSKSTKCELKTIGFQEGKIRIVYNAAPQSPKTTSDVESSDPLIAYVGRVKRYKRLDHLLESMKEVPNAKLIIAGKGDSDVYDSLRALAGELLLSSRVKLVGEVSEEEKRSILQRAWIYVTTSMKEGFGISVLEAQAFGVPVIAYDVPGLNESVKDLCSGILVRDGDIAGLARAITLLINDRVLREKLSRGARRYAGSFSWDKSAYQFSLLLNQIVNVNNTKVHRR